MLAGGAILGVSARMPANERLAQLETVLGNRDR